MTSSVPFSFDRHCDAIGYAAEQLCGAATSAGLEAAVPTCPEWTVRDLLAHLGMVHRWARAHVTGDRPAQEVATVLAAEAEGRAVVDPVSWLRDGARALVAALHDAPADLQALVFLKDAPSPRDFWARRQSHETTMHAVDTLSAALGRLPRRHRWASRRHSPSTASTSC
ncbi:maleylpyruvate isomerase family mycothiol-dependent enzyme [Pedococcus cremeus]|uniref:maleylpyruvate isomerase family mycothiol-dependent enzyme n=1 Tax=Pedococcus cremeus TaxID=587636 RepID=UPI000B880C98|nr:maleylpyruvate isomerase family mycothiol-dependent enzyme [Pedococcus cremeus]